MMRDHGFHKIRVTRIARNLEHVSAAAAETASAELLTGYLKNVTQFFLIAAMAAAPLLATGLDAVALGDGEAGAGVDAGAEADTDADAEVATELLLLLLLLEQAASAATRARPTAGTSRLR
jgi:hypothetical protein